MFHLALFPWCFLCLCNPSRGGGNKLVLDGRSRNANRSPYYIGIEDGGLLVSADAASLGVEMPVCSESWSLLGTVQPWSVITVNTAVPSRHCSSTTDRARGFQQQWNFFCFCLMYAKTPQEPLLISVKAALHQLLMPTAALRHRILTA